MAQALAAFLASRTDVSGIIGIGGSGNTALVTEAMRTMPVGLPKLMVSTVASGNVAAYMGSSDIALMYSVVDVAGLNRISRAILGNRSEEHTSELQSLMRISYAVFCLKKKKHYSSHTT